MALAGLDQALRLAELTAEDLIGLGVASIGVFRSIPRTLTLSKKNCVSARALKTMRDSGTILAARHSRLLNLAPNSNVFRWV